MKCNETSVSSEKRAIASEECSRERTGFESLEGRCTKAALAHSRVQQHNGSRENIYAIRQSGLRNE